MTESEIESRLSSPDNLLNRLDLLTGRINQTTSASAKESIRELVEGPAATPSADDLIDDLDEKIKRTLTKEAAGEVLLSALNRLAGTVHEVDKPEKLARIAKDMSDVVHKLNEVESPKDNKVAQQPIVIWKPMIVQGNNFETVASFDE